MPKTILNEHIPPTKLLPSFEKSSLLLRLLPDILNSKDIETFSLNVNRVAKRLFASQTDIVGIFVIQGDTGSDNIDAGGFTGDLYLLDGEDQVKVTLKTWRH